MRWCSLTRSTHAASSPRAHRPTRVASRSSTSCHDLGRAADGTARSSATGATHTPTIASPYRPGHSGLLVAELDTGKSRKFHALRTLTGDPQLAPDRIALCGGPSSPRAVSCWSGRQRPYLGRRLAGTGNTAG